MAPSAMPQPPAFTAPPPAVSEGQCSYDEKLWDTTPQRGISNGIMFDRQSGVTCEECLGNCSMVYQDSNSPWICRSLTYDHRWKICDLYAVEGDKLPYFLVNVEGRDYFELNADALPTETTLAPTEAPTTIAEATTAAPTTEAATTTAALTTTLAATTTTAAPVDPCGEGLVSRYCRIENWASGADASVPNGATTEAECLAACDAGEGLEGEKCVSAELQGTECRLYISALDLNTQEGAVADGNNYYQQVCLDETLGALPAVWEVYFNKILVGFVQAVETADSLADCKLRCLEATEKYGITCKSAMYYPEDADANCLLNTRTRYTDPNVFIDEDPSVKMMYLDVGPENRRLLKDDPIETTHSRWTSWMSCQSSNGLTYRFMKCKEKDVRRCPKQYKRCSAAFVRSQRARPAGACMAIVDHTGAKRCPHGRRSLTDGTSRYCSNPVDCPRRA